jgi:thiazole synthase
LNNVRTYPIEENLNGMTKTVVDKALSQELQSTLKVGSFELASRLVVGTGKYASYAEMAECLDASGTDCVTVAVRRDRLLNTAGENILEHLDLTRYTLLPNTAGCFSADDAVRVARLGRELLRDLGNRGSEWVKLEVLGDQKTLLPDPVGTIEATQRLVDDGFSVLVYSSDDPIVAKRLKDLGAASVMPAGSPIGSGQGILNSNSLRICLEYLKDGDPEYPVIVDAGVGTASDVAVAMELGVDGVLLNTRQLHMRMTHSQWLLQCDLLVRRAVMHFLQDGFRESATQQHRALKLTESMRHLELQALQNVGKTNYSMPRC